MANQFDRRGPAHKIKKHHDEASKDKMRAEKLAQRLYKFARAKGKKVEELRMEPAQVQAAKVLIERGKPALQAVEQKIVEEMPTEQEMLSQLHSLLPALLADPGVRAQVESALSGAPKPVQEGSETVVDTQQRSAA